MPLPRKLKISTSYTLPLYNTQTVYLALLAHALKTLKISLKCQICVIFSIAAGTIDRRRQPLSGEGHATPRLKILSF